MNAQEHEKDCSGCGACEKVCLVNAITMKTNKQGFAYPFIDESKCINCNLCTQICPFTKEKKEQLFEQEFYAIINKNLQERLTSSSGGMFILLAKKILESKGSVYGACLNSEQEVIHKRITTKEDLQLLQKSKYVQSNLKDTFQEVKLDLKANKKVLFSGTPCQIAGLKAFLKKENKHLFLVDVICHGVPSPLVWKKFIKTIEEKKQSKIQKFIFRDKSKGWLKSSKQNKIVFKKKNNKINNELKNSFNELFSQDLILRPSCFHCPYSNFQREGDITLGDFWGINDKIPLMFDNKGTSSVIINTTKGKEIFEKITEEVKYCKATKNQITQHNLIKPSNKNSKSKQFWREFSKKGYLHVAKKYTSYGIKNRIIKKTKTSIIEIIRFLKLTKIIKKIIGRN